MKYTYTVFRAGDGYAWGENTPEDFSEITQMLQQCGSVSHIYYIFHRGNVLEVRKAESPRAKERPFFVYTVDDFRNEDGVFSADTRNKAWTQVIRNFLTDCPPFHLIDCTEEQVPGLLQGFARHLPEKLTAGLLVDRDARQNYRFFDTSLEKIICDTESFRFLRRLPIFAGENRIFRALCFRYGAPCVSMLEFIAMLSAEEAQDAEKYFDPCMISKSAEYLLLSCDDAFLQEVRSKLDSGMEAGFGISREFVRHRTERYLAEYGVHEVQELRRFLHLFSCFGLPSGLLLPVLERWEQAYDAQKDAPPFLKKTNVLTYPAFVRAVQEHQGNDFMTDDMPYETLDRIYAYIQEHDIPASELEHIFQENRKEKLISDLLGFVAWSEHPEKTVRHPERNLLPALLYCSPMQRLVSDAELTAFYSGKTSAEKMKKTACEIRIPAVIRERSRKRQILETVLSVSGFLVILASCIRLIVVMLYEC